MSVLTHKGIKKLVDEANLISDFDEGSLEGASYDLKLGEQYIKGGETKTLTNNNRSLTLCPGEFALLSSHEKLSFPLNLVGHNGIMSPWAKRGLVSLFSPQIDPGFSGVLFVPVFNAGDTDITLTLLERIFTVEFVRTSGKADYGWSDPSHNGTQENLNSLITVPKMSKPNFSDIEKVSADIESISTRLNNLEKDFRLLEKQANTSFNTNSIKFALIVSVIALIVSVVIAFKPTPISDEVKRIDETKVEDASKVINSVAKPKNGEKVEK